MTSQNNAYIYNFILSSSLIKYDDDYICILGLDSSIPFHLFHYSNDLFINYPYLFNEFSLSLDSYYFLNICYALIYRMPNITNIEYAKNITFKYLDRFKITIGNQQDDNYKDLYMTDYSTIYHNGLKFYTPSVESSIAYAIYNYDTKHRNILDLTNIIVLSSIYNRLLSYNNVLINLLRLNLNIKNTLKYIIRDLKKFDVRTVPMLKMPDTTVKSRTNELMEFCYG